MDAYSDTHDDHRPLHPAGSVEPLHKRDLRATKHPKPRYDRARHKFHPRQAARRRAGVA